MFVKDRLFTLLLILSLSIISFQVLAHKDGGIVVKNAWVREAPPVSPVLAGYMTIGNNTSTQKIYHRTGTWVITVTNTRWFPFVKKNGSRLAMLMSGWRKPTSFRYLSVNYHYRTAVKIYLHRQNPI